MYISTITGFKLYKDNFLYKKIYMSKNLHLKESIKNFNIMSSGWLENKIFIFSLIVNKSHQQ